MSNEMQNLGQCIKEAERFVIGDYIYVFYKNGRCKPYIWYDNDDMEEPMRVVAVVTNIYQGQAKSFLRSAKAPEVWVETVIPIDGKKRRCNLVWCRKQLIPQGIAGKYVDYYDCVPYAHVLDKVAVKEYLLEEKQKRETQRAEEESRIQAEVQKREERKKANDLIALEELHKLMNDLK